jgi:hypothetical protein
MWYQQARLMMRNFLPHERVTDVDREVSFIPFAVRVRNGKIELRRQEHA